MRYLVNWQLKNSLSILRFLIEGNTLEETQNKASLIFEKGFTVEQTEVLPDQFGKPLIRWLIQGQEISLISELPTIQATIDQLNQTPIRIRKIWTTSVDVAESLQTLLARYFNPGEKIDDEVQMNDNTIDSVKETITQVVMDADAVIINPPAEVDEELIVLIRRNINQIKKSLANQDINRWIEISKQLVKQLEQVESQTIHSNLSQATAESSKNLIPELNQLLAAQKRNRSTQQVSLNQKPGIIWNLKSRAQKSMHDYSYYIQAARNQLDSLYWKQMINRRTDVFTSSILIAATFIAIISVFKRSNNNLLFPLLITAWLSVWGSFWYLLPTTLQSRPLITVFLVVLTWVWSWFLWAALAIW